VHSTTSRGAWSSKKRWLSGWMTVEQEALSGWMSVEQEALDNAQVLVALALESGRLGPLGGAEETSVSRS
jgi:hypothetical protein